MENYLNTVLAIIINNPGICEDDIYMSLMQVPKEYLKTTITFLLQDGKIQCIYTGVKGRYFKNVVRK